MEAITNKFVLAIESGIAGGSIAILNGTDMISGVSGSATVSRAEDLIPRLEQLLHEAGLKIDEIGRIAVSLGPGSYTGLRIGIATVMGLCRGLQIEYVGVPIFHAISSLFPQPQSLVALPMGRSDICISLAGSPTARVVSAEELRLETEKRVDRQILVHASLYQELADIRPDTVDIGTNLAKFVGMAANSLPESIKLEPIYIQKPRFG